jgi:hypothetical protein
MNFTYVVHEITQDVKDKLKVGAVDLTKQFKVLTQEEMALLAEATDTQRVQLIDKLFARAAEATAGTEQSAPTAVLGPISTPAPTQTAPAVGPGVGATPGFSGGQGAGPGFGAPIAPPAAPSAPVSNGGGFASPGAGPFGNQQAASTTNTPIQAPTPNATAKEATAPKLSDAEFLKMFTPKG